MSLEKETSCWFCCRNMVFDPIRW